MINTNKNSPVISVVIPAHNEDKNIEKTIFTVISKLKASGLTWEIVVVDDGSQDQTLPIVCQLAENDKNTKVISLSRNFGKECAIYAGLEASQGQAVITIDADGQHPPDIIPLLIQKWQQGFQVVHAIKRKRNNESPLRSYCVSAVNRLISRLGNIDIRNSSDYKLLDRYIVNLLVYQLPERRRFYRGLSSWLGFQQAFIEFDVLSRSGNQSSWSIFQLAELAITALTSFTSLPLRIITVFGVFTLVLGFFVATDALLSFLNHNAVSGFTTIIICLLLIGSFIMISLGVIGEYIANIYEEIKARPIYIANNKLRESIAPPKILDKEYVGKTHLETID